MKSSRMRKNYRKVKSYLHNQHPLAYNSWVGMRQRVHDNNRPQFKDWGGRGITICARWDEFKNFLEDMGDPPIICGVRTILDRKDNDGPYCKDNCQWAFPGKG